MASLAMSLPVLPGRTGELRRFVQDLVERRGNDFAESERQLGITRESWHLQPIPSGEIVIVYVEGDNPLRALGQFVASQSPFDRWFKEQVLAFSGIDLNQPPAGPPSEVLFDWQAASP